MVFDFEADASPNPNQPKPAPDRATGIMSESKPDWSHVRHTEREDRSAHYIEKPDSVIVDFYKDGQVVVLSKKGEQTCIISHDPADLWRPIETAPRDESEFLISIPGRPIEMARWLLRLDCVVIVSGSRRAFWDESKGWGDAKWMPLPPEPNRHPTATDSENPLQDNERTGVQLPSP